MAFRASCRLLAISFFSCVWCDNTNIYKAKKKWSSSKKCPITLLFLSIIFFNHAEVFRNKQRLLVVRALFGFWNTWRGRESDINKVNFFNNLFVCLVNLVLVIVIAVAGLIVICIIVGVIACWVHKRRKCRKDTRGE